MKLNEIPNLISCKAPPLSETAVMAVTEDSRRAVPGAIFVAAPGVRSHGGAYAEAAVRAGAVAVIGSETGRTELAGVPYVQVDHPREALGILAHALAGEPSRGMTVVGITGTNGKSSSVLLAQQVLQTCGAKAAAFGTLGYDIAGEMVPAVHTTPFGEDLAAMFGRARDAGVTHVVMEASSHALEQERVAGIDFDVAAFTNLTQDHLDYHTDMANYRQAKLRLFERIEGAGRFTVVNKDDPSASYFIEASRVPCHTFGANGDCRPEHVRTRIGQTRFTAVTPWGTSEVQMTLLGYHNVSNALCAISICCGLGLSLAGVAAGIASLTHVPGRFEAVNAGQDFQVIVDYAHTDDGLKNVLTAAREVCEGRVITVFGCGGDRDVTKRPKMGAVAAELSDFAIVTSDNPRTEDPNTIIAQIEPGVESAGMVRNRDYRVIPDRAEAIHTAIGMAKRGDLVLLAGKGHEDYQILGTARIHFDDREVARAALEGI
ncbi:MAG: UDP-N-acetylmuramoyl-L-alanyl-D-glutamate--2,6-diaminopimelate ligase [Nitrospiraceae bacterium]|nr:UDP-N-acetylmuramoyl-L-alanyl-D-glutamate--2,6-diaminopimelate ligase [Nitrospiraceae bacterium]